MKKQLLLFFLFVMFYSFASAQTAATASTTTFKRPKLVVGIVIDQMRWDYLYRYNALYKSNGGFKRFLNQGFTCENTFIPYTPTVTAAGHTCIYTGSVPGIHGITGNEWYDKLLKRDVYCAEDTTVQTVGSNTDEGKMSPRNMLVTTVGDELRLATNFKSKVIGIAIKDRGAILPAGHAANAAYWYDGKTGNFITSTYYMKELPSWVQAFNQRKVVDSLYKLNWNLALPENVYEQYSTADEEPYENKPLGKEQTHFPYKLEQFAGTDYGKISATPYGNTLTEKMAEAAVLAEKLGKSDATDFLAVSFSSPDYVGHAFGPNSWEQLDDYVRLDAELEKLLSFLDATVGKDQYTVFLTADHGVAHVPKFSMEHNLPGGFFSGKNFVDSLNMILKQEFGKDKLVVGAENYQIILDNQLIENSELDKASISNVIINYLQQQEPVSRAFRLDNMMAIPMNAKQREMFANGYYPTRSGDIQIIVKPGYVEGSGNGTSHGLWNPYDSHIPFVLYGWGIKHGSTDKETYMTDIAPTIASLLHIQLPSGSIGRVIEEVMK